MSSSASLPSPEDDYAAPLDARLNKAFWDAALKSVGARIRALEAVKATWEELISQGTGQALAVIQANVEPQLVALTTIINQLKAEVAAAEDAIAVINAGGINMSGVVGLSAALALKADLTYVDTAIAALKGDAPAAYDTLVEIAAKLSEDDTAIAGLLTTIATKASKDTKLRVGAGFSLDGIAGSDANPAAADLSSDRLLLLDLAAKALAPEVWAAGVETAEAPISPAKLAAAIAAFPSGTLVMGMTQSAVSGNYIVPDGVHRILALLFGGGGGGGQYVSAVGGDAGLGGYAAKIIAVTPGESIPYTIGAGGGATAAGGTSSFSGLSATGGSRGGNGVGVGADGIGTGGDVNGVASDFPPGLKPLIAAHFANLIAPLAFLQKTDGILRVRGSGSAGVSWTSGATFAPGAGGQGSNSTTQNYSGGVSGALFVFPLSGGAS